MRARNDPAEMNRRCLALEMLGFDIHHQDSNVRHPSFPNVVLDFSSIAIDRFTMHACDMMYRAGIKHGKTSIIRGFKTLMEISENDSQ